MIKPSSLGDIVHTLPGINLMARQFPGLEIRWIVGAAFAPLLEDHPALAEAIVFPRDKFRGLGGLAGFYRWLRTLDRLRPDVALDFQGLLRSALMGRFSGAARIVGMRDSREGAGLFYDEKIPVAGCVHAVDRYLEVVKAMGVRVDGNVEPEYLLPQGHPPERGPGGGWPDDFVLLHPFARGEGKALTRSERIRFCEILAPRPVIVVGQTEDAALHAGGLPGNAVDLANRTTLLELLWLMRRARFTVSVDSGPMHLAAAVGGDLLGIHTWTDPRKVGPYRGESWVWKAGAVRRVRELAADDAALDENRREKVSGIAPADIESMAAFVGEKWHGLPAHGGAG